MVQGEDLVSVVLPGERLKEVEPDIYALASDPGRSNEYDGMSRLYDHVMGNWLYNRLMWGYSIASLEALCRQTLAESSYGWVLDAGCGSLVFTAPVYAQYSDQPVILVDQSLAMLRRAKARMLRLRGEIPRNMVFFHGDACALPFRSHGFGAVICFNLLHVLDDVPGFLRGLVPVLRPGGLLACTTLVRNNRLGDSYMQFLSGKGLIIPRTGPEVLAFFDGIISPLTHEIDGNMLFVHNCTGRSHV